MSVQPLGWEYPLKKGMATPSSVLAWRIPWMEEPDGLQFIGFAKSLKQQARLKQLSIQARTFHLHILFLPKVIVNTNSVYIYKLTSLYILTYLVKKKKKEGKQIHIVSSIFWEQSIYFYNLSFSVILFLQLYGFLLILCLIIYMCSLNINN